MAITYTGQGTVQLIRQDREFVFGQGWSLYAEYQGRRQDIFPFLIQLARAGWEATVENGPNSYKRLVARKQAVSDSQDQDYYDRIQVGTELVEKDIWSLKVVQDEISAFGDANTYRDTIEKQLDEPSETKLQAILPSADYPVSRRLLRALARGVQAFEDEAIVLQRERVVPRNYAQKIQLTTGQKKFYSSARLISEFALPTFLNLSMPTDIPDPIANTQWGWLTRKHDVTYMDGQKAKVIQDWTFAQWSTFSYDYQA